MADGSDYASAPDGDGTDDLTDQQRIDAQELRSASPQQDRADTSEKARDRQYGGKDSKGKIHGMNPNQLATDSRTSVGATKGQWITMSTAQKAEWGQHLVEMGIITQDQSKDPKILAQYWNAYAEEAGAAYASGNKKASPFSVSAADGDLIKALGGVDGETQVDPNRTEATTSQSWDITNPTEAASKINDVFRTAFGRDAAPGELTKLAISLREAEYDNPINTSQTTQYEDNKAVSQKTLSQGGVDPTWYITQKAKATPEYGAYQAATTYANELFKAISSPV